MKNCYNCNIVERTDNFSIIDMNETIDKTTKFVYAIQIK